MSPATMFSSPEDVVESDRLTKREKVQVLEQWEADAKALQTATDEGMSGGKPSCLDEVKGAQTNLEAKELFSVLGIQSLGVIRRNEKANPS